VFDLLTVIGFGVTAFDIGKEFESDIGRSFCKEERGSYLFNKCGGSSSMSFIKSYIGALLTEVFLFNSIQGLSLGDELLGETNSLGFFKECRAVTAESKCLTFKFC